VAADIAATLQRMGVPGTSSLTAGNVRDFGLGYFNKTPQSFGSTQAEQWGSFTNALVTLGMQGISYASPYLNQINLENRAGKID
jgi:hypothetical protein